MNDEIQISGEEDDGWSLITRSSRYTAAGLSRFSPQFRARRNVEVWYTYIRIHVQFFPAPRPKSTFRSPLSLVPSRGSFSSLQRSDQLLLDTLSHPPVFHFLYHPSLSVCKV